MRLAFCALSGETGHAAGRRLLAELYRQETGEELPEIRITDRGKPFFPESCWHFSISHTPSHAFCALSRNNVAVDAEELDRKIPLKLADKILSPGEKNRFDRAENKELALLTFWVLKEAEAKLTGEGLKIYPNHTDFSLEDPRVTQIAGCLVAVMEE